MAFDLAVGLHRSELDAISETVFKVAPAQFKGSREEEYQGIKYTVTWNITTPAKFDLSAPAAATAALAGHLAALDKEGEHPRDLLHLAAASTAAFSFTYEKVTIALSAPGVETQEIDLTITAQAKILANPDGSQSLDVYGISAPLPSNPVQAYLIQEMVLPRIQASAQQIFGNVVIPALQIAGLQLSAPVPFVQDEALIAIANLATAGPPQAPEPGTFTWPASSFFVLLGNNAMQAATAKAIGAKSWSGKGSSGSHAGGYDWHYELEVDEPRVSINGTGLNFNASITGRVGATVYVVWIPLGVGFEARAAPQPSGTLALEVRGSEIVVKTGHMNAFTLLVVPSGSVPEQIGAWIIEGIVAAVVAFAIPTYEIPVGGTKIVATPTGLSLANVAGMLALEGKLSIQG
jgi:hypothetical protein